MQKSSMVLGALTSLAAGVTGVMAYGAFAPSSPAPASSPVAVAASVPHVAATAQRPRVRYRPCPLGARVEDGICVTRVMRTVAVLAPAAQSQGSRSAESTDTDEPGEVLGGDDTPGTDETSDTGDESGDESGEDEGTDDADDDSGDEDAEDESDDETDEDGDDGDHEEADDDQGEDDQDDGDVDGDQDDQDEEDDGGQEDGGAED